MKASELITIWRGFGVRKEQEIHTFLGATLAECGDRETRTTPELIHASIEFERNGITFMPIDPTCTSCNDKDECDKDWVEGHRPDWWICAKCKRVMPCWHEGLENINEQDLTATCSTCYMRVPRSFVAEHLQKKHEKKAEWFRSRANNLRQYEEEEREYARNPQKVEMVPTSIDDSEMNWGL
jgi:hypothetical protein